MEHNKQWVDLLRARLEAEELSSWATVIHAPLTKSSYVCNGIPIDTFYNGKDIEPVLGNKSIDCLVVDGPPAHEGKVNLARYPAVPFFQRRLAGQYSIFLDDIDRKGERLILAQWEEELGISFQRRPHENIAFAHSHDDRFTIY